MSFNESDELRAAASVSATSTGLSAVHQALLGGSALKFGFRCTTALTGASGAQFRFGKRAIWGAGGILDGGAGTVTLDADRALNDIVIWEPSSELKWQPNDELVFEVVTAATGGTVLPFVIFRGAPLQPIDYTRVVSGAEVTTVFEQQAV